MKPISEMSHEELSNLVCYHQLEIPIYYDKLTIINTETSTITYNNTNYKVSNSDHLKELEEGKIRYEAYKLAMSQSQAEQLLQDKATESIETYLSDKIETIIVPFTAVIETAHSKLSEMVNVLDTAKTLSKSTEKINTELQTLASKFNTEQLNKDIETKVAELREVKSKVENELAPIKKEFKTLVTSLQGLFEKD